MGGLQVCYMTRRVPFYFACLLFCVCMHVCICMYMCAHIMYMCAHITYMCVLVCLDVMRIVECVVCGDVYDSMCEVYPVLIDLLSSLPSCPYLPSLLKGQC